MQVTISNIRTVHTARGSQLAPPLGSTRELRKTAPRPGYAPQLNSCRGASMHMRMHMYIYVHNAFLFFRFFFIFVFFYFLFFIFARARQYTRTNELVQLCACLD